MRLRIPLFLKFGTKTDCPVCGTYFRCCDGIQVRGESTYVMVCSMECAKSEKATERLPQPLRVIKATSLPPTPPTPLVASTSTSYCWDLRHYEERCPNCNTVLSHRQCRMTYSTWKCMGCGATLDSRVVRPKLVHVGVHVGEGGP